MLIGWEGSCESVDPVSKNSRGSWLFVQPFRVVYVDVRGDPSQSYGLLLIITLNSHAATVAVALPLGPPSWN